MSIVSQLDLFAPQVEAIVYGPFISRKEAMRQGLSSFFTGIPCKRGHIAPRKIHSSHCVLCIKEIYSPKWNRRILTEEQKQARKEYQRHYRLHMQTEEQKLRKRQDSRERARRRREGMTEEQRKAEYAQRYEYLLSYINERRSRDDGFRLRMNLRHRIWGALRGATKADSLDQLVGCDAQTLMAHLEAQFTDRMTWENYGKNGWHVDHVKPCASFDLTDPEQQRACFHYTNLQPLWWDENIRKGAKVA
jgi:hypothetical protein